MVEIGDIDVGNKYKLNLTEERRVEKQTTINVFLRRFILILKCKRAPLLLENIY